tara:strand:+ start:38 stop:1705 length:1668 start_codon:yes stop_codon:yes gene_type:complete
MNFRKIYIKSGLFLIQMLLAFNFVYSQQYILEFKNTTESEKKTKKYKSYKDLILAIEDTLVLIKKQGFYDAKVNSLIRKDSFNYEVILNKNQMVKYIEISNKSAFDENIVKILNKYTENGKLIRFKQIESVTKEITDILSESGYPFAKVGFINYELINPTTIKLEMEIKYGSKRNIDKVIVKGYENFPKNFIKNIFKPGKSNSLDVDKALSLANKIDKTGFARNIKDPEILFTKDSSALYLYIEKIRRNTFDGFLSFDTDENSGKINIEGYAKINLFNTFNGGEKINFDFRSQKNQDRSLNSDVYIPYVFGSPLNLKYGLNLIQKDSSYTSNENLIDIDMIFGNIRSGLGLQTNKSTSEEAIENVENFKSKLINVFSEYIILDNSDQLIPELFKISLRYGSGVKEQSGEKTNFSKYSVELHRKFNLSSKFKLQSSITRKKINSKNLVNNELLRFGGYNSIRGYDENSIFTDGYTLLKTSLNYYLNDTIYIYTIFDLANYSNEILDLNEDIYSGGIGFSSRTDNGIVSISYSKGNNWGNSFNLKNAKINVIFVTFF